MNYALNSIVRKSTRGDRPFNVLTWGAHEAFETIWCHSNIKVYSFEGNGYKSWNHSYRKPPTNYHLLNAPINIQTNPDQKAQAFIAATPLDIEFDCVVIHNAAAHRDMAYALANYFSIPIIEIQHCLPNHDTPKELILQLKNSYTHKKVFITDYSRDFWGYNENEATVIRHAMDTELFTVDRTNQINRILTVANEYKDRDYFLGYSLYEKIVKGLPSKNIGHCPGLSEAAKDVSELIEGYQKSTVFLNTSLISPTPMSLLEAATCGCAIVTTATAEIPYFFQHGENALMSNDPNELRKFCIDLMNNEQERIRLGDNARKMILEKCSIERFTNQWNTLLNEVCK